MGSDVKFCKSKAANKRLVVCSAVVLVVLLTLSVPAVCAEGNKESLREIHDQAEQLAKTPDGAESAIAKYRSLVDIHRENEKLFQSALRKLAKHYRESGRAEEGARFLIDLAYDLQTQSATTGKVLRDVLQEYSLTHRELLEKIAAEKGLSSRPKPKPKPKAGPIAPSKEMADAILQRKDRALRAENLQKLRDMLSDESSDADKSLALATLGPALTAKFDRAPFKALVLKRLKSRDAQIRALALSCLPGLGASASDLDSVIPLAEDPSPQVRMGVGAALIQLGKGEQKDKVIPVLMKLLKDKEDQKVIDRTIVSMWGQYSSPDFDALLIELSRNPSYHHNAIYYCLSTMRTKSLAVCRRLVEVLDKPELGGGGRAAWGLTYGVNEDAKSIVEEGLLTALPEETDDYTRGNEFRALRNVATEKSRPYLKSVIDSQMEKDEYKKLARRIIADLDRKGNK